MPKAKEIAQELRRIADSLDREPEVELVTPMLSFYNNDKETFLASVRALPRPLAKDFNDHEYTLEHGRREGAVWLRTKCDRSKVCKMVKPAQPAVYDCSPLLSAEEEESLTEA
jgi:hypothetical protein